MSDSNSEENMEFSKGERGRIADSLKPRRHESDEMYELYEKVREWHNNASV